MFEKPTKKVKVKKYIARRSKTERAIWIKALDDLVSKMVRQRDGKCINCRGTERLTCSHFWNRNKMGTRWSLTNCDAACWTCHKYHLEKQKQGWYRTFKLNQLGESEYLQLEYEASSPTKFTVNELKILYKDLEEQYKLLLLNNYKRI